MGHINYHAKNKELKLLLKTLICFVVFLIIMIIFSCSCQKAIGEKQESQPSIPSVVSVVSIKENSDKDVVIGITTDNISSSSASDSDETESVHYTNEYAIDYESITDDNLYTGTVDELTYLGDFFATAYTHTGNNTATGVYPKANHTVGVDPNIIPYGTTIVVEVMGELRTYVAEDTGYLAENQLDIFYDTYDECIQFGVRECKVWILEWYLSSNIYYSLNKMGIFIKNKTYNSIPRLIKIFLIWTGGYTVSHSNNINVKHFFLTNNNQDRKKSINYAMINIIQQHIKNKTTILL